MRYLLLLLFMALGCTVQAEAEPMTVRCDRASGSNIAEPQPYFMTFDIEKRHFMFEHAGGSLITGEILSVSDEQLDLSLRGQGGRILLSYDRKHNMMVWPGLPAGELRRSMLQHACTEVSGRTVLSLYYQPERFDPKLRDPIDAFSISCPGRTGGFYFITMDRVTKTVVVETEHYARVFSGNITGMNDGVIKFTFGNHIADPHDAQWDERNQSLTLIGITGNSSRPTDVHQCTATKPRSIMERYEDMARWGK